jgi:acyl-CoA thioesterase
MILVSGSRRLTRIFGLRIKSTHKKWFLPFVSSVMSIATSHRLTPTPRNASTQPLQLSPEDAQAQALVSRLLSLDGFGQLLGIELVEARRGVVTVRMQLKREHINFLGTCHGAVIFGLADMASGLASNSFGMVSALVHGDITVHAGSKEGDWITAYAAEVSRTRKLAVARVDVTRADGTLLSCLTCTNYLTNKPLAEVCP